MTPPFAAADDGTVAELPTSKPYDSNGRRAGARRQVVAERERRRAEPRSQRRTRSDGSWLQPARLYHYTRPPPLWLEAGGLTGGAQGRGELNVALYAHAIPSTMTRGRMGGQSTTP